MLMDRGILHEQLAYYRARAQGYDESMVEGFVNKVKRIKHSSYGQAGFPLLQTGWLVSMGLPSACSSVCFSACWSQEPGGCGANQRRMRCDCPGHLEDKE
jgi:hypothetical protein